MRRLATFLLVLTAAGLPGLAQEPSQPAGSPQMSDAQRIALCAAKAKKPLEPSDVEPVLLGRDQRPELIHSPWPQVRGREGHVKIEMIIDEDGCAREPKIRESTKKKLGSISLEAVEQWVYRPIQAAGKTVRVRHFVAFNFKGRE